MLEIINSVPYNNIAEDIYFSQSKINLYKPDFEKSKQFSIEQCFCEKSFGCHQPWHKPDSNKIFDHYNEVSELYRLNTFNNEIIITLTTIPSRLKYLDLTINSILSQDILPDKIIINIPLKYNNFLNDFIIPDNIIQNKNIIINRCTDYTSN